MHTDEYEISLFREIDVCKKAICKIRKSLQMMEKKYNITTEEFVEGYLCGKFSALNKDFIDWNVNDGLFKKWQEREKDYEEILERMKI